MPATKKEAFKVIEEVTRIPRAKIRVPDWAIKTTFVNEEERERFTESVKTGYTPLHVAECEEAPGVYELVDGVHRFDVLESVPTIPCYNHGKKTIVERKALAVRFAWNFTRDNAAFAEALRDIQEIDSTLLVWSPLEESEVNRLIAELNIDLAIFDDDEEEEAPPKKEARVTKTKSVKSIECPHCGKSFNV